MPRTTPKPSVLFGRMGETCHGAGQRCVMVANSWGLLQPAYLDGKGLSASQAAVALLQDQNAIFPEVNGTKVTPDNIHMLMGIKAVAKADGAEVPLPELERRLGSGASLQLTWEPVPGFEEAHAVHALSLLESRHLHGRQKILPLLNKVTDWMSGKSKRVVANVVDFVENSNILKTFVLAVRAITNHLVPLFQCIGDLPPEYHLGGFSQLLNQFIQDHNVAFKELYRIWVKRPFDTLVEYVKKEMDSTTHKQVKVEIGESSKEEKCVEMPLAGALHCEADSIMTEPARAQGEEDATFQVFVKEDHTTVCVKRTDATGGWKSNIGVACEETMQNYPVLMGRSTGSNTKCLGITAVNMKCHKDAAHLARLDYASVRNESGMIFETDVDVIKNQVCVTRVDDKSATSAGWDVDLRFVCKVSSFQYQFEDIIEGTWKDWNFERMWIMLEDLMTMENMEAGYCFTQHILWPLKEPAQNVVRGALSYADSLGKSFLSSTMELMEQSLEGLQLEEIDFAGIKVADVTGAVAEKVQAMCMDELEAQIEGTTASSNLTGAIVDSGARMLKETAKRAINWMVQKVKDFAINVIFVPLLRQVSNIIIGAADTLMLIVEGVCGLIPEVGGFICDIVTVALSQAITWLQEPVMSSATLLADAVFDPIQRFFAEFIVANTVDAGAGLLKTGAKKLSDEVRGWTDAALGKLPWVGDGPGQLISVATAHKLLDHAVTSILRFVRKLFGAAFPSVKSSIETCTKLNTKLATRLKRE